MQKISFFFFFFFKLLLFVYKKWRDGFGIQILLLEEPDKNITSVFLFTL
jgi:hypothetical protein